MAGDGGRVPDVSEQRAEIEAILSVFARERVTFGSRMPIYRSQVRAFRLRVAKAVIEALNAARASDPASVLVALLAESPEATVAAIEALLTSDEAVEAGASTIVEQDLLMRADDSLAGLLEVTADPAREFYEDAVRSACRSLLSKAPKGDGDA